MIHVVFGHANASNGWRKFGCLCGNQVGVVVKWNSVFIVSTVESDIFIKLFVQVSVNEVEVGVEEVTDDGPRAGSWIITAQ